MTGSWVKVEEVDGGQVVVCKLCGKSVDRRTFWASDTNYAEALRLATAHAWRHENGPAHRAALDAFHAKEAPAAHPDEAVLHQIFGTEPPDEMQRRRSAAKQAARYANRTQRQDS